MRPNPAPLTGDDAFNFLVSSVKGGKSVHAYGYDVYLDRVMWLYLVEHEGFHQRSVSTGNEDFRMQSLSPYFYAAAWELCRRGILRPGVREHGAQATDAGSGGNGYSLTPFGKEWFQRADATVLASILPGRFFALLNAHSNRFGGGFRSRGHQAILCYHAQAYLACCAMCGAGAESILLALATEAHDPTEVLKTYTSSGGRGRVRNMLVGQMSAAAQREFDGFISLINYWRDESAHGIESTIEETEAFVSLMLLLRFARYADETFRTTTA